MINEMNSKMQLPNDICIVMKELKILKHLRKAGITKSFGYSCGFLFQLILCLVFEQKNWFRVLQSDRYEDTPAKDAVYRFLNQTTFAWRRFLLLLSAHATQKVARLTSHHRPKVLIIDDSAYERNRSKKVELLARCFDHSSEKKRFYKGFRMLTLAWSDGATLIPIDFSLLSSISSRLQDISQSIDKRCHGYRRRLDALRSAPEQIPEMIERALNQGIEASYVLMDTWFTHQPLVKAITEQGLDVIGMVKKLNQRYWVHGKSVDLNRLYQLATPIHGKKGLLRSIVTEQANGVPVKIVFVRNRNKKSEWLAILSTDLTLNEEEIIRIYGIRWDIEVFFKTTKSFLKLQKEFQSRSYDALISHTTIVFVRYIILSWQHRCSKDPRSICELFYVLCDEITDLDWAVALQQLVNLLEDTMEQTSKRLRKAIMCQLHQWIEDLPRYIRAYLPFSLCES